MTNERIMNDPEIQDMIMRMSKKVAGRVGFLWLAEDFAQELVIIMRGIDGRFCYGKIYMRAWWGLIDVIRRKPYSEVWGRKIPHVSFESAITAVGGEAGPDYDRAWRLTKGSPKLRIENLRASLRSGDSGRDAIRDSILQSIQEAVPSDDWELLVKSSEGWSDREIAEGTDVSRSMISKRRNKTLKYLRRLYERGEI